MSSITVTLADSIQQRLEEFAKKDELTVEEFVSPRIAVAEAQSLVQVRAARGSVARLVGFLDSLNVRKNATEHRNTAF